MRLATALVCVVKVDGREIVHVFGRTILLKRVRFLHLNVASLKVTLSNFVKYYHTNPIISILLLICKITE